MYYLFMIQHSNGMLDTFQEFYLYMFSISFWDIASANTVVFVTAPSLFYSIIIFTLFYSIFYFTGECSFLWILAEFVFVFYASARELDNDAAVVTPLWCLSLITRLLVSFYWHSYIFLTFVKLFFYAYLFLFITPHNLN